MVSGSELTQQTVIWHGHQQSIPTLTANFMTIYERPSKKLNAQGQRIDGLNNRINHAEAVYDRVQLIKKTAHEGPPVPVTPPTPPIPSVPVPPVPAEPPPVLPPVPTVPASPIALPPVSAAIAGRQAALKDALDAMGAGYLAELEAYRREMNAMIDAAIANFKGVPVEIAAPGSPSCLTGIACHTDGSRTATKE